MRSSPHYLGPRLPSALGLLLALSLTPCASFAQTPSAGPGTRSAVGPSLQPVTVVISVRDKNGGPVDNPAIVRFFSNFSSFNVTTTTREGASVTFPNILEGEYEVEVKCAGYKEAVEHISVVGVGSVQPVYLYMTPESETAPSVVVGGPPRMTPKLQAEIDKGIELMRKNDFEGAYKHFSKAAELVPSNPDVLYYLATAQIALNEKDQAKKTLEKAVSLAPTHEKALLALGRLQLEASNAAAAVKTLEQAYAANGANWKTHLLLASAYQQDGQNAEAESHAARAAQLAGNKAAPALLFLGEIQYAEGKYQDARSTWERVITTFSTDPSAAEAKHRLAAAARARITTGVEYAVTLPPPQPPNVELAPVTERVWAPSDVDSKEYAIASNAACQTEDVLNRALQHMQKQLLNFEKFTATEHIEHQDVDRFGIAGPPRAKDFSYIVFVHPFNGDSMYLEEERDGGENLGAFPTAMATTGLNSLGISLLQPAYRESFNYSCEGLTSVRGQAAWQIHFSQKPGNVHSIRTWKRNGVLYEIPLKGRVWISSATYDLLRIETDLREPSSELQLVRDHLLVDYGPVNFQGGSERLWLPWSAEMYLEVRGRRYHHKHYLSDYMLFAVDTSNKIHKPKNQPPAESSEPQKEPPAQM
jgi:Flp pilus assembly protein TadD